MGIVLLIRVPWRSAGSDVHFRLKLVMADGQSVIASDSLVEAPIAIEGNLHVNSPVGVSLWDSRRRSSRK
jgi:hypothetical protein